MRKWLLSGKKNIYFFCLMIYTFCNLVSITMIDEVSILSFIFKLLRYITYFGFGVLCCVSVYPNKIRGFKCFFDKGLKFVLRHYILLFYLVLSLLILLIGKNRLPLVLALILWGSYEYDFKEVLKIIFKVNVVFMAITMLCELTDFLPDIIITRGSDLRYSMGYIYPLELMSHFLFIVLMYIFLRQEKFNTNDFLYINAINILLFKITDARTSFLLVLFVTLSTLIITKYKLNKLVSKINIYMVISFVLLCSLGSFLLALLYTPESELMLFLDKLLSGRLELGHNAIASYGITLFGQKIEWVGFGAQVDPNTVRTIYNFVDCSYLKNAFDMGILFLLFTLVGYIYIGYKFIHTSNIYGILILMVILVLCVLEPRLVQIAMNPFIILAGDGLLMDNESMKEVKVV